MPLPELKQKLGIIKATDEEENLRAYNQIKADYKSVIEADRQTEQDLRLFAIRDEKLFKDLEKLMNEDRRARESENIAEAKIALYHAKTIDDIHLWTVFSDFRTITNMAYTKSDTRLKNTKQFFLQLSSEERIEVLDLIKQYAHNIENIFTSIEADPNMQLQELERILKLKEGNQTMLTEKDRGSKMKKQTTKVSSTTRKKTSAELLDTEVQLEEKLLNEGLERIRITDALEAFNVAATEQMEKNALGSFHSILTDQSNGKNIETNSLKVLDAALTSGNPEHIKALRKIYLRESPHGYGYQTEHTTLSPAIKAHLAINYNEEGSKLDESESGNTQRRDSLKFVSTMLKAPQWMIDKRDPTKDDRAEDVEKFFKQLNNLIDISSTPYERSAYQSIFDKAIKIIREDIGSMNDAEQEKKIEQEMEIAIEKNKEIIENYKEKGTTVLGDDSTTKAPSTTDTTKRTGSPTTSKISAEKRIKQDKNQTLINYTVGAREGERRIIPTTEAEPKPELRTETYPDTTNRNYAKDELVKAKDNTVNPSNEISANNAPTHTAISSTAGMKEITPTHIDSAATILNTIIDNKNTNQYIPDANNRTLIKGDTKHVFSENGNTQTYESSHGSDSDIIEDLIRAQFAVELAQNKIEYGKDTKRPSISIQTIVIDGIKMDAEHVTKIASKYYNEVHYEGAKQLSASTRTAKLTLGNTKVTKLDMEHPDKTTSNKIKDTTPKFEDTTPETENTTQELQDAFKKAQGEPKKLTPLPKLNSVYSKKPLFEGDFSPSLVGQADPKTGKIPLDKKYKLIDVVKDFDSKEPTKLKLLFIRLTGSTPKHKDSYKAENLKRIFGKMSAKNILDRFSLTHGEAEDLLAKELNYIGVTSEKIIEDFTLKLNKERELRLKIIKYNEALVNVKLADSTQTVAFYNQLTEATAELYGELKKDPVIDLTKIDLNNIKYIADGTLGLRTDDINITYDDSKKQKAKNAISAGILQVCMQDSIKKADLKTVEGTESPETGPKTIKKVKVEMSHKISTSPEVKKAHQSYCVYKRHKEYEEKYGRNRPDDAVDPADLTYLTDLEDIIDAEKPFLINEPLGRCLLRGGNNIVEDGLEKKLELSLFLTEEEQNQHLCQVVSRAFDVFYFNRLKNDDLLKIMSTNNTHPIFKKLGIHDTAWFERSRSSKVREAVRAGAMFALIKNKEQDILLKPEKKFNEIWDAVGAPKRPSSRLGDIDPFNRLHIDKLFDLTRESNSYIQKKFGIDTKNISFRDDAGKKDAKRALSDIRRSSFDSTAKPKSASKSPARRRTFSSSKSRPIFYAIIIIVIFSATAWWWLS